MPIMLLRYDKYVPKKTKIEKNARPRNERLTDLETLGRMKRKGGKTNLRSINKRSRVTYFNYTQGHSGANPGFPGKKEGVREGISF